MARGVALEFTTKSDDPAWRRRWRWALTSGSLLIPLLIGVGLGDLLHGLPINSNHDYTGDLADLDLDAPLAKLYGLSDEEIKIVEETVDSSVTPSPALPTA